jgi:hypothetical protein
MAKASSTCYMCPAAETSREHVPAACFFPEKKDLPPGVDLRRHLVTVPSCDSHNSRKSKDDQYFWQIVTATQGLNECGDRMVRTKVARSISRRPALVGSLMRTAVPAYRLDPGTGRWSETVKVRFDADRLSRVLEQFARALYFWHFGSPWSGVVGTFPNFALFTQDSGADREFQRTWRRVIENTASITPHLERLGENQDVFYYQVVPPDGTVGVIMSATFYGSAVISIGYMPLPASNP